MQTKKKKIKLRHFHLDIFEVSLQYKVSGLCNHLLLGFSSNHFETLHRCYMHIEDVHVNVCKQKKKFLTKLRHFRVRQFGGYLHHRVASVCNPLLPGFSSNQFETLNRCYKHIEEVHVFFCRREKKMTK